MAYDKIYPKYDDEILPFDKGQEDRIESEFNSSKDKVIDSGSNSNGYWEKYESGKILQWGIHKTNAAIDLTYGSLFRSDTIEITYPQPVKEVLNYGIQNSDANSFIRYVQGAWLTVMQVRAVHIITKPTAEIETSWYMIGKWK